MIIRAEEGKIIIELNEHEKELSINEDEVTLANRALNRFVNLGLDANRLVLKQNTTSYATISYRGNSFDHKGAQTRFGGLGARLRGRR